jgi:hypothetical protein
MTGLHTHDAMIGTVCKALHGPRKTTAHLSISADRTGAVEAASAVRSYRVRGQARPPWSTGQNGSCGAQTRNEDAGATVRHRRPPYDLDMAALTPPKDQEFGEMLVLALQRGTPLDEASSLVSRKSSAPYWWRGPSMGSRALVLATALLAGPPSCPRNGSQPPSH